MKYCVNIVCITFILSGSYCTRDKSLVRIEKNVNISPSLKNWALFEVGSYWIYKDSVSNSIDSVYVTSVTSSTVKFIKGDTAIISEQITVNFNSLLYSFMLQSYSYDFVSASWPYSTIFDEDTTHIGEVLKQNYTVSTLSVSSIVYSNLRYIYFANNYSNQNPGAWVIEKNYWKKNIGIVKRRIYNLNNLSNTYELVRYNIVQ